MHKCSPDLQKDVENREQARDLTSFEGPREP